MKAVGGAAPQKLSHALSGTACASLRRLQRIAWYCMVFALPLTPHHSSLPPVSVGAVASPMTVFATIEAPALTRRRLHPSHNTSGDVSRALCAGEARYTYAAFAVAVTVAAALASALVFGVGFGERHAQFTALHLFAVHRFDGLRTRRRARRKRVVSIQFKSRDRKRKREGGEAGESESLHLLHRAALQSRGTQSRFS